MDSIKIMILIIIFIVCLQSILATFERDVIFWINNISYMLVLSNPLPEQKKRFVL